MYQYVMYNSSWHQNMIALTQLTNCVYHFSQNCMFTVYKPTLFCQHFNTASGDWLNSIKTHMLCKQREVCYTCYVV